jgi:hypothetical protein
MVAESNTGELRPLTQVFREKPPSVETLGTPARAEIRSHYENGVRVKPQIGGLKLEQTTGHQANAEQKEHGNRHLRGHQKAPQTRTTKAPQPTSFFFEGDGQITPGELQSGRDAEQNSRAHRHRKHVYQDAEVRGKIQAHARKTGVDLLSHVPNEEQH